MEETHCARVHGAELSEQVEARLRLARLYLRGGGLHMSFDGNVAHTHLLKVLELLVLIELPVLEEEGLSSDLGHSIKHNGLFTEVHWSNRTLGWRQRFVGWHTCS